MLIETKWSDLKLGESFYLNNVKSTLYYKLDNFTYGPRHPMYGHEFVFVEKKTAFADVSYFQDFYHNRRLHKRIPTFVWYDSCAINAYIPDACRYVYFKDEDIVEFVSEAKS